jgi:hypothetical protein
MLEFLDDDDDDDDGGGGHESTMSSKFSFLPINQWTPYVMPILFDDFSYLCSLDVGTTSSKRVRQVCKGPLVMSSINHQGLGFTSKLSSFPPPKVPPHVVTFYFVRNC